MNRAAEFHAIVRPSAGETGFGKSYEQVAGELAGIPRLHIEPDGSLVWVSAEDVTRKVNGQVTDDGREVMYLEVRGRATWDDLQPILAPLKNKPGQQLTFQLLPGGELIEEVAFRDLLERI